MRPSLHAHPVEGPYQGMMPGGEQAVRHPGPPRPVQSSTGQAHAPPGVGQDSYMNMMQPPFRPAVPPSSQPMARPHGGPEMYHGQPGFPLPVMEPSAVSRHRSLWNWMCMVYTQARNMDLWARSMN